MTDPPDISMSAGDHAKQIGYIEHIETLIFSETKIIQISVDEIKTREFNQASPYKGLKRFEAVDKDRFFGRDQFLIGLVNELEQTNLLLLLGASGSGKSSVIRAGLIPWLSQKWGSRFTDLTFTPNQDPFNSLCQIFHDRYPHTEAEFILEGKADSLTQVVNRLKPPEDFWFIFIDQFEELFTIAQADKSDRFIHTLLQLVKTLTKTQSRSVKIVATMRADFLDRLSPYSLLIQATDKHRPMIAEMQSDELRLAIEQPPAHHGVVFETELVQEIIKDVQGQAGYLPLLQYTLDLLWETEKETGSLQDRTLNISTYRRLGGVRGALQKHVDEFYSNLSKQEQLAVQRIFLKLVEIGGDEESGTQWRPIRRRANRSEFSDELEKKILTRLINQNLLISDRSYQSQESTIEIAHEILLTSWTTLNTWIRENRQAIALRNRLNADVALWRLKKADSDLWSGAKLEKVAELRKDSTFTQVLGGFDPIANEFIDASLGKRNRELRFYRNVAIGAVVASIWITGSLIFAGIKWQTADRDRISAELTSSKALFERNQATSDALLEALRAATHLQHSIWLRNDVPLQAKAMETLAQAIYAVREHNHLKGHTGSINSVSFSPDRQVIGTASSDKTARLWSADGKELQTLTGHTGWVTEISFSRDGHIATASLDGTAILWNRQGKKLQTFNHRGNIWSVQFSPDGRMIATAGDDKTVKLWDLNGTLIHTLTGHTEAIYKVRFSPKEPILATASADKTVKLWDLQGNMIHSFEEHRDQVISVNFSSDGQVLASASNDKTVILWDCHTKTKIGILPHSEPIRDAIFSPDGQTIATASNDKIVRLWRRDGTLLEILPGHRDWVNSLSFNGDGNVLASASNDKTVKLWRRNIWRTSFIGHQKAITSLDVSSVSLVSPDGNKIASASEDATVKIWNLQGQLLTTLPGGIGITSSVRVSPNGKLLATASRTSVTDPIVRVWNLQGKVLKPLKELHESIPNISFSPDSKTVAIANFDKTVKLWNYDEQDHPTSLRGHDAAVWDVDFSRDRDGRSIVSGDGDGIIKLWNRQGTLLRSWKGHNTRIYSIRFSPDNQTVASASEDGSVKLWDREGNLLHTLKDHEASVTEVRFSLDGSMIATASTDTTVKLWTHKGELITTLIGHADSVNSIGFTPDSKILATASADAKLFLWNVENLNMNSLILRGCNYLQEYFKAHPGRIEEDICGRIAN